MSPLRFFINHLSLYLTPLGSLPSILPSNQNRPIQPPHESLVPTPFLERTGSFDEITGQNFHCAAVIVTLPASRFSVASNNQTSDGKVLCLASSTEHGLIVERRTKCGGAFASLSSFPASIRIIVVVVLGNAFVTSEIQHLKDVNEGTILYLLLGKRRLFSFNE
jgi:hypothetical protein